MSTPSRKEISPVAAAIMIVLAVVVILGVGLFFFNRSSSESSGSGPARAPQLPKNIPPPPTNGPIAVPPQGR